MNLTQLGGLETKLQAGKSDRSARANQECEAAIAAMQRAHAEGYRDKSLLKRAHTGFITAIRLNRQDPTPLLGLSYLLVLIGDPASSRKYLQEALRLEPESEEALQLLSYLTALEKGSLAPDAASPEPPIFADHLDYDALYEQVENFIRKQLHQLMSRPVMPSPTLDPERLKALKQEFSEVKQQHDFIAEQIGILDKEIDTAVLLKQLRPFESISRRLEQALQTSAELYKLQQALQTELSDSQGLHQRAQTPQAELTELEYQLELTMDRCDALADELDRLEALDDFKHLQKIYENLIQTVEEIRDTLDLYSEQIRLPAQAVA